jgi:hypothetical protein
VYLCRVDWAIGDGSLSTTTVDPNKPIKDKRAAPSQRTAGTSSADAKAQAEYDERIHNWFNQDGNSDHV